jgi:predicted ATPase
MDTAVDALNLVQQTGEKGVLSDLLCIEGDLMLARATAEGSQVPMLAEKSLTRALSMARAQQARSWELRAATSLARLYCVQGRPAEAVGLVTPVVAWFTEGRDTCDVRAAHDFLSKVSGA